MFVNSKILLAAKKQQQMTYQHIAVAADLSIAYVHQVINGKAVPSIKTLAKLCSILGVDVADVITSGKEAVI